MVVFTFMILEFSNKEKIRNDLKKGMIFQK